MRRLRLRFLQRHVLSQGSHRRHLVQQCDHGVPSKHAAVCTACAIAAAVATFTFTVIAAISAARHAAHATATGATFSPARVRSLSTPRSPNRDRRHGPSATQLGCNLCDRCIELLHRLSRARRMRRLCSFRGLLLSEERSHGAVVEPSMDHRRTQPSTTHHSDPPLRPVRAVRTPLCLRNHLSKSPEGPMMSVIC